MPIANQGILPHPFNAGEITDFDGHRFAGRKRYRKRKQQESGGSGGFIFLLNRSPNRSAKSELLKIEQAHEEAQHLMRLANAIRDHAFALDLEFEIANAVGSDRVVRSDIAAAHHAAQSMVCISLFMLIMRRASTTRLPLGRTANAWAEQLVETLVAASPRLCQPRLRRNARRAGSARLLPRTGTESMPPLVASVRAVFTVWRSTRSSPDAPRSRSCRTRGLVIGTERSHRPQSIQMLPVESARGARHLDAGQVLARLFFSASAWRRGASWRSGRAGNKVPFSLARSFLLSFFLSFLLVSCACSCGGGTHRLRSAGSTRDYTDSFCGTASSRVGPETRTGNLAILTAHAKEFTLAATLEAGHAGANA